MATNENVIFGGQALDDLLKTLAPKIEKNIMRTALRAGGKVLLDEAKTLVPKDGGALERSLRVSTKIRKGQVTANVKAGNAIAYYSHMVEFGTRAHTERASPGHAMAVAGFLTSGVVYHPGARAHPFMRPAADNKFNEAVTAIADTIRKRLTKEGLDTAPSLPPDDTEGDAP